MLYAIAIPPHLAAAVAAGQVGFMTTTAGATTTLVASGGVIVGTATIVPAGGAAGAATIAAGAGSVGFGAFLAVTGIGLAALGVIGFGCWVLAEDQKRKEREAATQQEPEIKIMVEGTEDDARAVLAEVQAIVDQAQAELDDREVLVFDPRSEH